MRSLFEKKKERQQNAIIREMKISKRQTARYYDKVIIIIYVYKSHDQHCKPLSG